MITIESIDKVRDVVSDVLRTSDGVQGSKLASAIRKVIPSFQPSDYGARSFRDFLETHVPSVAVVGNAGMDVMYGLASTDTLQAARVARSAPGISSSFWRAWASPASGRALDIADSGEVTLVELGQAQHHELRPLPAPEHRKVAEAFLATKQEAAEPWVAQLRVALENQSEAWWIAWMSATRSNPALNAAWLRFRRQRLQEALETQIGSMGLSPEAYERALSEVLRSRRVRPEERLPRPDMVARHPAGDVSGLRELVKRVIDLLDEGEVRRLALPVGTVFDVLAGHRS